MSDFGKEIMKHLILILLLTLLAACSTAYKEPIAMMEDIEINCETQHEGFADTFDCLKSDPDLQKIQSDEIDLFFLKGEQLKEKIAEGNMTLADARFEWKKLIYDIKQQLSEMRYRRLYESSCRVNYRGRCVRW